MSQPVAFTCAFAELVWLLVYRPGATDEQKRALRAALVEARAEGFVLSLAELNRAIASAANLSPIPAELPWLHELAARMAGHSVGMLEFSSGAKATDLLGLTRALSTPPRQGDEGTGFDTLVLALRLTTVNVRLGRAAFVRRGTPIATSRPTPVATSRITPARPARTPGLGILSIEGSGSPQVGERVRAMGIGVPTPVTAMQAVGTRHDTLEDLEYQDRIVEAAFTRPGQSPALRELLQRLEGELDGRSAPIVLDDLTRATEDFAREGRWADVTDVLRHMVVREAQIADSDVKRAFLIHLRRLFKPGILRALAHLLTRRRELRAAIEAIFVRSGDAGADILVELLAASNVTSERRTYRTALVSCPAAIEPLTHLLHDPRWYVVRNAAELLGEMGVQEADGKLISVLKHSDARVRRSAAGALARLGTTRGVFALQPLLADHNATVRLQAVHGISSARLARSVPSLLQALERENDPGIQHALLIALGAHPTDEAVERLAVAAKPGSLLSRKPTPFRLAAVHALGEAGTPAALASLRAMQGDRDRDVRAAVELSLSSNAQGVGR
ncbi:MAG: HEAT repeat domain-containing protein [Gemmatimonadota bacterium]